MKNSKHVNITFVSDRTAAHVVLAESPRRRRLVTRPTQSFTSKARRLRSSRSVPHRACLRQHPLNIVLVHRIYLRDLLRYTTMSQTTQLEAGQQLVKKTMQEVMEQKTQTTEKVSIQARQEFREHFQESYEEEFEEETHIDEFGNETTKRVESSSESKEHSRSADVKVKASGLNTEQVKALTDCANQAGQLALDSKSAN